MEPHNSFTEDHSMAVFLLQFLFVLFVLFSFMCWSVMSFCGILIFFSARGKALFRYCGLFYI